MPISGWVSSTTGARAPVYTSPTLGDLFGATSSATTTTSNWYSRSLTDMQTATQTLTNTGRRVWWTDPRLQELADWTATTNTASTYWTLWENDVEHSQYIALAHQRVIQTRVRTAEERARDETRRAQAQAEQLRLAQERAAALQRSRELLLGHLTAKQRETFEKNLWFVVEGGRSKQLYRIRNSGSYSANIEVLEGKPGKVTHRLCCHLADYRVPLYDHLLAQKVWIEHDEDDFLRLANRHAA